jgi:NADH:ubiquinone oxidoreductase subunit 6 (subunit J)
MKAGILITLGVLMLVFSVMMIMQSGAMSIDSFSVSEKSSQLPCAPMLYLVLLIISLILVVVGISTRKNARAI